MNNMEYNLVITLGGVRQDHPGRCRQTFFLDHGYGNKPVFDSSNMLTPAIISLPPEYASMLPRNVRVYDDYNGCGGCSDLICRNTNFVASGQLRLHI
jgi:hypothetical protein